MINKLPRWIFTPNSRYDTESVTEIEAIGKLQGKMNELVDEYNKFVDQANEKIESFVATSEEEQRVFEMAMRQEFQDFIDVVNIKFNLAVKGVEEAVALVETTKKEMIEDIEREKAEILSELEIAGDIVQTIGDSESSVMSQKAVTDQLAGVFDVVIGKNLLNQKTIKKQTRFDDNGNETTVDASSACVTDFIPVCSGDTIHCSFNDLSPMNFRRCIGYDLNKNFVSLLSTYQNNIDIISDKIKYLRFQFTQSEAELKGQIEFGKEKTAFIDYNIAKIQKQNRVHSTGNFDIKFPFGYVSDFTMIGERLVGFYESSSIGTMDGKIYSCYINEVEKTGSFSLGLIKHDFGHCNTVDYCKATDCLVFGDGGGLYNGSKSFFIIPEAHKILERAQNTLSEIGIEIDCSSCNFGDKLNVCWGYDNNGRHDVVILITNDNKKIRFVQLGKGTNNLGLGNYSSALPESFNGSFKVLTEYDLDDGTNHPDARNCNQGSQYKDGKLYIAVGHEPHRHWEITFQPNGKCSYVEVYEPLFDETGTQQNGATEGICVTDNYLITNETNNKSGTKNILAIKRRI